MHILIRPMLQTCRAQIAREASTRLVGLAGQACICSLDESEALDGLLFLFGISPPPPHHPSHIMII